MTPVLVPNPERGCGRKKKGGCYAESGPGSVNGVLIETWCLGAHIEGRENFYVEVPPRGVHLFNPAASLSAGELVTDVAQIDLPVEDGSPRLLGKVGTTGLIDHVGAASYTPRTFAAEAFQHGISRRIPPAVARDIAFQCPLPIFFVAPLPIFPDTVAARAAWVALPREDVDGPLNVINPTPSWRDPRWSLRRQRDDFTPYRGQDHYMAQLIMAGATETRQFNHLPHQQALFFAGWIIRVTYVLDDGESDLPDELKASGVLAGILEDDPRAADL